MSFSMWLSVVVFVAALLMIASKRFHKAVVAIAGGAIFMTAGLVSTDVAVHFVNWKAVFLLVGMMIIISVIKRTGVFQYIAIRSAKAFKGNPISIMITGSLITAACSAFFGPVLSMMTFAPVSILIAIELGISPLPFLISQTLSANIGGIITLVGDPVSVLIGTETGFSFGTFVANNGPIALITICVSLFLCMLFFRNQLVVSNERRARIMDFDESRSIQDKGLLVKCLCVVAVVIAGFVLGPLTGVEPSVVALSGAVLLLILAMGRNLNEVLKEIDWEIVLFLVGLFIMTIGLQSQGITREIAHWLNNITDSNPMTISLLILWASAFAAATIDTLPFVILMVPVIQALGVIYGDSTVIPMWWALSLGSVFGGNATLVGAQSNLTVAGISTKSGYPLSFSTFGRYASPLAVVGLGLSSAYIVIRYFVLNV